MKKLTFSIESVNEDNKERLNVLLDELMEPVKPALKRLKCHKHNGDIKIHLVYTGDYKFVPEVHSCCDKFVKLIAKKVEELL